MLEHEVALKEVISWLPQGQAFKVFNAKEFEAHLLPKYFKHSKIASFQRQLNLYGFKRICKGDDVGAYYHVLFLRGRRDLLRDIQRVSTSGKGNKAEYEPETAYTTTVTNATTTTHSTTTTVESVLTTSSSLSSIAEIVAFDGNHAFNANMFDYNKTNENDNERYISVLDFLDDNYIWGNELYEYRDGSVHTTRQPKAVSAYNTPYISNNLTFMPSTTHPVDITKNPYYNKFNAEKYRSFCENITTKPSKITQNIGFGSKIDPRKSERNAGKGNELSEFHASMTPIVARVVDDVFGSCDSFSMLI